MAVANRAVDEHKLFVDYLDTAMDYDLQMMAVVDTADGQILLAEPHRWGVEGEEPSPVEEDDIAVWCWWVLPWLLCVQRSFVGLVVFVSRVLLGCY